jgi:hypothetical protein
MPSSQACPLAVIETKDGPYTVPHDQIAAIVQNAERQAELTATTLKQMGLGLDKVPLPRNFLLELGAVLQLQLWENRGSTLHLKAGLPAAQLAANELAGRATKGWAEFEGENAAPLSAQVLSVWIEQFAWSGQEFLEADVVVGEVDEEEFADVLAEFLWTHRHQLRNCLPQEEETK